MRAGCVTPGLPFSAQLLSPYKKTSDQTHIMYTDDRSAAKSSNGKIPDQDEGSLTVTLSR